MGSVIRPVFLALIYNSPCLLRGISNALTMPLFLLVRWVILVTNPYERAFGLAWGFTIIHSVSVPFSSMGDSLAWEFEREFPLPLVDHPVATEY